MRITLPPMLESRKTVHQRYEAKYLLTPVAREMVRDYVLDYSRPDAHQAQYRVTSVYYDSLDWHTYRSSFQGEKNRFKLRVRAYGLPDEAGCFAEVKQRIDRIIVKKRVSLTSSLLDTVRSPIASWTDHMDLAGDVRETDAYESYARVARRLEAAPRLGVRYLREAFESVVDEPVRVTVDSELAFLPIRSLLDDDRGVSASWREVDSVPAVLEVKFTDAFPYWIRHMIERFELTRVSLAKYVVCVQSLAGEGGLREANVQDSISWTR